MRRVLRLQFVRFLLVGGLNTGFSYGMYAALLYVGLGFVVANLVATILGIGFSFMTSSRMVFGNAEPRLIFRYAACWGAIWVLNVGLIALFVHAGLNAYWAGAVAMVPVILASYLVQKLVVFAGPRPAPGAGSAR